MGVSHLPILIILVVVALIVFGPKRLPELGHGLGKAITEFKKGMADLTGSHEAAPSADVPPVGISRSAQVEVAPEPTVVTPLQGAPAPADPAARVTDVLRS